jgi:hypothetical protein
MEEDAKVCRTCGNPGSFETYLWKGKVVERLVCRTCRNAYKKKRRPAWRAENLEPQRKRQREYMRRFRRKYWKEHPEKRKFSKPWAKLHLEKYLYITMQRRTYSRGKKRGARIGSQYQLKMTFVEFLDEIGGAAPAVCPVLGIPLIIADEARSPNLPTVDRIDNSRPYERGNIAIISRRANVLKNDGTLDEHRKVLAWMEAMEARQRA